MEYWNTVMWICLESLKLIEGAIMTNETIDSAQAAWISSREPLK